MLFQCFRCHTITILLKNIRLYYILGCCHLLLYHYHCYSKFEKQSYHIWYWYPKDLPSGKQTVCYWKWPLKSLIYPLKMVIFHINHHVPMVSHGFPMKNGGSFHGFLVCLPGRVWGIIRSSLWIYPSSEGKKLKLDRHKKIPSWKTNKQTKQS